MLNSALKHTVDLIYNKSKIDSIPHVRKLTIDFIIETILNNKYTNVLEIGTAYGYSAGMIALHTNAHVISIEKSLERYEIAKQFLVDYDQIRLVNIDCNEFTTDEKFDLMFIDGPKAKQIEIVEKYSQFLSSNGTMIIDNIYMKKFIGKNDLTKNQQKLVASVQALQVYLMQQTKFDCKILDIDDGIGVLTWKK